MFTGLEYPITRPIALGFWFNFFVILGGVGWITVVTIINVAAVGYELVPFTSTNFNASTTLWYERFTPMMSWFPQGRTCEGSIIKIGECFLKLLATTDLQRFRPISPRFSTTY